MAYVLLAISEVDKLLKRCNFLNSTVRKVRDEEKLSCNANFIKLSIEMFTFLQRPYETQHRPVVRTASYERQIKV